MADDIITKQELVDAKVDAQTLEEVTNGDSSSDVTSRLGRVYPTIAKALYAIIQNGGFEPFQTEAELKATVPTVPKKAAKALDTRKIWYWNGSSWIDTGLSDTDVAKDYTDNKMLDVAEYISKNKYNPALAVDGWRVGGTGALNVVAGAKHTGHIPVEAGKTYTMSWSNTVSDIPFYSFFALPTDASNPISYSITGSTASPRSFTVPSGANFVVINLKHGTTATERTNFQLEEGATATAYEPYDLKVYPNPEFVADLVRKEDLEQEIMPYIDKDYEVNVLSKNLFDESQIQNDRFLATSTGGISSGAGWKISGFIPVVAGKKYTLSGQRARQGISFFTTNTPAVGSAALSYDNTATLPLTVTAPTGANYAVLALESATVKGWSDLQFEEGDTATAYHPYGYEEKMVDSAKVYGLAEDLELIQNEIDLINSKLPDTQVGASIKLTSGSGVLKTSNMEFNIKVFNPITYTGNPVFNFVSDSYNGLQIRVNGDDVAPVRMMGATIGANHGYSKSSLTMANHGKTVADVGSVWTDGTNEWVITQIESTSVISVTCRTANIGYNTGLPQLTHVSGAANTANIVPTATTARQWYPMLKNHSVKALIDNTTIVSENIDATFSKSFKVAESYNLMEKSDIVEWLILNGGKEVKQYNAASALSVSHVHSFDTDNGDTIYSNFFTYKALSAAQDLMFTQAARFKVGADGAISYYVPRSIPFTHDAQSFDFSKPFNVDSLTITNRIDFTVDKTESGKAVPDRLVMFNDHLGFAIGYLPILDAAPDVRNTNTSKGIQISQFEAKVYPYLVDGLTTLPAGAHYSCVAYRKYFEKPVSASRICEYYIENENDVYLFLDWVSGGLTDSIDLRNDLIGKKMEVVEITDNVVLLTESATAKISAKINTVSSNARLVLKFS